MNIFHSDLIGRWNDLNICEQMAHIGAEVGRANNWRKKGDLKISKNALFRALELIDFTVSDPNNKDRLNELLRMREILLEDHMGGNCYKCTDASWDKYFLYFNIAARQDR